MAKRIQYIENIILDGTMFCTAHYGPYTILFDAANTRQWYYAVVKRRLFGLLPYKRITKQRIGPFPVRDAAQAHALAMLEQTKISLGALRDSFDEELENIRDTHKAILDAKEEKSCN